MLFVSQRSAAQPSSGTPPRERPHPVVAVSATTTTCATQAGRGHVTTSRRRTNTRRDAWRRPCLPSIPRTTVTLRRCPATTPANTAGVPDMTPRSPRMSLPQKSDLGPSRRPPTALAAVPASGHPIGPAPTAGASRQVTRQRGHLFLARSPARRPISTRTAAPVSQSRTLKARHGRPRSTRTGGTRSCRGRRSGAADSTPL